MLVLATLSEGCLTFDPDSKGQVTLVLRIAGVKKRRELSPERKAELAGYLANARRLSLRPPVEEHLDG